MNATDLNVLFDSRSFKPPSWETKQDKRSTVMLAYAVKIETTSDGNGNPRRGFLIYNVEGQLLGFADCQYGNDNKALRDAQYNLAGTYNIDDGDKEITIVHLCSLSVPVKEYRNARGHKQL